jgi:hypothetical protein
LAKTPEQRLESRAMRELRKQIIRLKRENAQLRKRNSRIENDFADFGEEIAYESLEENVPELHRPEQPCPKCGSNDIVVIQLRGLPYYRCQVMTCNAKGKLPQ